MSSISLVFLTYNNYEKFFRCMNSMFFFFTERRVKEILILDNGSYQVELKDYLRDLENQISKVRVVNCETGNNTHPFSDKRSGVNHAIDSTDIFDGVYLEGTGKRIKNPESIVQRLTSANTSLDYKFTIKGYEFYQDETPQNWAADCTVGGEGRLVDCKFKFSYSVAEANKSILTLNDLRLTNGDAGITPENTTAKLVFEDCEFENVTLIIKCNSDFINCSFNNCIIIDAEM